MQHTIIVIFISGIIILMLFACPVVAYRQGCGMQNENTYHCMNLENYLDAVAPYDNAIAINQSNDTAWAGRGDTLYDIGLTSEAVDAYDRAVAINPGNASVWVSRGLALDRLGNFTEAMDSFDRADAIRPDIPETWFGRGIALGRLGRNDEAVAMYDKYLAIFPNETRAWVNRGAALYQLGRKSEAIASFDKALNIDPNEPFAKRGREIIINNRTPAPQHPQPTKSSLFLYAPLGAILLVGLIATKNRISENHKD